MIITMAAGYTRHKQVLGHFHASSWVRTAASGPEAMHELFVGGEGLAMGPEQLLVTLLHETAHGVAFTRGLKDTSRQGRWHNSTFRTIAAELGVATTKSHRLGWSDSALADRTAAAYSDQLAALTTHRRTFAALLSPPPTRPTGPTASPGRRRHQHQEQQRPPSPPGLVAHVHGNPPQS